MRPARIEHDQQLILRATVFAVTGYALWVEYPTTPKVRFAALFLVQMAGFGYGPIVLSWAVANASPDTIRAVTAATVVGIGSIGSIASTWTYVQTDAKVGYANLFRYMSMTPQIAEWIPYRQSHKRRRR